ncbi:hypothetical protein A3770_08p51790 [Chloropicon primus]|uniref:SAP domain-containing protein n=1 Tax=Chloropicon primus TaxID=1764295 RepID=A0A5B8MQN6_9CHLO|nr:hypothetical protein A3770_08p51790 [Chloropicon primus]|eukprot:QDZ22661.1 hypothetical protein A3770_08p51790 [Chloropicon primus]
MRIPAELQKMTIAQLKEELVELGGSTKGCKLKVHYQERLMVARRAANAEEKKEAEVSTPAPAKPQVFIRTPSLSEGLSRPKPFSPVKTPKAKSPKKEGGRRGSASSSSGKGSFSVVSVLVLLAALAIGVFFFLSTEDTKAGHEKVNELFETARDSVNELYLVTKGYIETLDLLKRATEEFQNVFGGTSSSGGCKPVLSKEMLSSVVFQSEVWSGWSSAVIESMSHAQDDGVPNKGTAILLARNTSYSGSVYDKLEAGMECNCIKRFVGANVDSKGVEVSSKSKGQVQKELAEFLTECTHGIVVVEGIESFGSDSLSPLHNAMSEQGGLTYNGTNVPGWNAKYILTLNVPMEEGLQNSEDLVKQVVKQSLVERLGAGSFALAFRRRIDYVGLGRI